MKQISYMKLRGSLIVEKSHFLRLVSDMELRPPTLKYIKTSAVEFYNDMISDLDAMISLLDAVDISKPTYPHVRPAFSLEDWLNFLADRGERVITCAGKCYVVSEEYDAGWKTEYTFIEVTDFPEK